MTKTLQKRDHSLFRSPKSHVNHPSYIQNNAENFKFCIFSKYSNFEVSTVKCGWTKVGKRVTGKFEDHLGWGNLIISDTFECSIELQVILTTRVIFDYNINHSAEFSRNHANYKLWTIIYGPWVVLG